jgi:hypothetical protein
MKTTEASEPFSSWTMRLLEFSIENNRAQNSRIIGWDNKRIFGNASSETRSERDSDLELE